MVPYLERLYRHLAWADREMLRAIDPADARLDAAFELFAHLVAAEHVWISRIRSHPLGDFGPWQKMSYDECKDLSESNAAKFLELVGQASDASFGTVVHYKTSKGDEMRTPLGDILLHVALHGSYHRGQVASRLKGQGRAVPATDYIVYSRLFPVPEDS